MSRGPSCSGDFFGNQAEEPEALRDNIRRRVGGAVCEVFDIAGSDDDGPASTDQGITNLETRPALYQDDPRVQLAFLELQESKARCRRMETLYYEARKRGAEAEYLEANPDPKRQPGYVKGEMWYARFPDSGS